MKPDQLRNVVKEMKLMDNVLDTFLKWGLSSNNALPNQEQEQQEQLYPVIAKFAEQYQKQQKRRKQNKFSSSFLTYCETTQQRVQCLKCILFIVRAKICIDLLCPTTTGEATRASPASSTLRIKMNECYGIMNQIFATTGSNKKKKSEKN